MEESNSPNNDLYETQSLNSTYLMAFVEVNRAVTVLRLLTLVFISGSRAVISGFAFKVTLNSDTIFDFLFQSWAYKLTVKKLPY